MYTIYNRTKGLYIKAQSGTHNPFTSRIELAVKYATEAQAQANCCPENESPMLVRNGMY